ncbi:LacI family DNA-binding transcriptional regulator [Actinotignum urinale]|uniref:LacI family DNA-binding transcriptional regulator n=1 Tax=Actinotignum urinale TaxID=190146 RepID=UPI002A80CE1D|nr:LacI family DNA-binding transcriptional regulator [Actinotignum urinale]MDY5128661.1 LacI family DNA-binding transcriptional regulator [Actinotignum urinale]
MNVTMADVARHAQVSVTTVSHVMNGTRRVNHATRERVLATARQLGYKRRSTVRSLGVGGTPTIGMVGSFIHSESTRQQFMDIAEAMGESGWHASLLDSQSSPIVEEQAVAVLLSQHVDAVVISPLAGWRRHSLRLLRAHGVPFVVVNNLDHGVVATQIGVDRTAASQELTASVFRAGATLPVLVYPDRGIDGGTNFMRGFEAAHRQEHRAVKRMQLLRGSRSDHYMEHIFRQVLEAGADGFVLGSSYFVRPVMRACANAGLYLGKDVWVGVYDDAPHLLLYPEFFIRSEVPSFECANSVVEALGHALDPHSPLTYGTHSIDVSLIATAHSGLVLSSEHDRDASLLDDADSPHARVSFGVLRPSAHGRRHAGWLPTHIHSSLAVKENIMTPSLFPDRYFPGLHIRPKFGWVNDANGFHKIGDTYHMFYQFNPLAPWHNQINWGHATSKDLVNWTEQPVALKPRHGENDSAGCWSGVGLMVDGESNLLYTAVSVTDGPSVTVLAQQRADKSGWDRVGVVAGMPPVDNVRAMRDPFIFEVDGHRWAIHGAGYDNGTAAVLVYNADDWHNWTYVGPLLTGEDPIASIHAPAHIWECPQLVQVDGRWVLVASLWVEAESLMDHLNGVGYLVGDLDFSAGYPTFIPSTGGQFDRGSDFYAPQCKIEDGRVLVWGWSWEGSDRTDEAIDSSGYNGALTFPREIVMDGEGRIVQRVAPEVHLLREKDSAQEIQPGTRVSQPRAFSIDFVGEGSFRLIDNGTGRILLDQQVHQEANLWVDGSMVEYFNREPSLTVRVYPEGELCVEVSEGVKATSYVLSAFDAEGRRPDAFRFLDSAS